MSGCAILIYMLPTPRCRNVFGITKWLVLTCSILIEEMLESTQNKFSGVDRPSSLIHQLQFSFFLHVLLKTFVLFWFICWFMTSVRACRWNWAIFQTLHLVLRRTAVNNELWPYCCNRTTQMACLMLSKGFITQQNYCKTLMSALLPVLIISRSWGFDVERKCIIVLMVDL